MPVLDLNKVRSEVPRLAKTVEQVGITLQKKGLDPTTNKAAVIMTLDHSGSTEMGGNRLYSDGTMRDVADIAFSAGLHFDDDGEIPVSFFDQGIKDLGNMNLGNAEDFISSRWNYDFGGTSYLAALKWIVRTAGFDGVDLSSVTTVTTEKHGHFGRSHQQQVRGPLSVKATAEYPTFALVATDGEPQDSHADIIEYMTLMSQLPIFVQFVGVGHHDFEFLRQLDEMDGRFVDNANFFDAKDANHDPEQMLGLMFEEFPDYYIKARNLGLVTSK